MLVPAAPVEQDIRDCPFETIEECRAWLEKCCGAGARLEELCPVVVCESEVTCGADSDPACARDICCKVQVETEQKPTCEISGVCCGKAPLSSAALQSTQKASICKSESESACCTVSTICQPTELKSAAPSTETESPKPDSSQDTEQTCDEHSSPSKGQLNCEWCCCCPVRPTRVPDPPQTPVAQRPSNEKTKVESTSAGVRIVVNVLSPVRLDLDAVNVTIPSNDRQAILCIWRE